MNNEENVVDEDIVDLTDIDDEEIEEEELDTPTNSEENQQAEQDTNATNDVDDSKFLDFINSKEIVYNGEKVKVDNMNDLISTYQKGLNYEKMKQKAESVDDEVVNFIHEKAQAMGITDKEYIQRVKNYEAEQQKQQTENQVQNLISKGLDEETARDVAQTKAFMEQLKSEKAKLQKQKEESEKQAEEDKEYEEFLSEYPNVDVSKIPAEVFRNAKEIGLSNAYAKYENKILKEKLKIAEQNKSNASNSIVTPTSDGSSTEQMSKDAFFDGFDSED